MSFHRACCPCGSCYCGTLCQPCILPCADTEQPPETVCIPKATWDANIDDVTSGTGTGWVIWVDGAYYFFDGSLSQCSTEAPLEINWLVSFRADGCPDLSLGFELTIPFVGGFSWGEPWTVNASCSGIENPTVCAGYYYDPIGSPDLISATPPILQSWSVTCAANYATAYEQYYGAATFVVTHGAEMTPCVGLEDVAVGYKGTCGMSGHDSVTTIEGTMAVSQIPGDFISATAMRFTRTCSSGTYLVELGNDSDGFFTCKVNSTCEIRYIGPVAGFAAVFNAVFSGGGIVCDSLDDDWFLGCKVRAGYEGTVDQPTFPNLLSVSPTVFGLAALGSTQDIDLADIVWGKSNTDGCLASDRVLMDARAARFFGKSSLSYDDPGFDTDVCPSCGADTDGLGGYTGFAPSHSSQETSTAGGLSGVVRERYGVSLHPREFTWTECPPGLLACELQGVTWVVT